MSRLGGTLRTPTWIRGYAQVILAKADGPPLGGPFAF